MLHLLKARTYVHKSISFYWIPSPIWCRPFNWYKHIASFCGIDLLIYLYSSGLAQWHQGNRMVNTLRTRQIGRRFADNIFKRLFQNEIVLSWIKVSLKFVPKVPYNNIPKLVHMMAWRRQGAKPLSEPMVVRLPRHICATQPEWVKSLMVK